jgi:hypothetical protein
MEILGGGLSAQALDASHVWSFRGDHCTMKRHEDQHRHRTVTCETLRWSLYDEKRHEDQQVSRTLVTFDHLAEVTVRYRRMKISTALDASHVWSLRGDHCAIKRREDQHRHWTVTCDHSAVISVRWGRGTRISTQALDASHVWSFRGDHCAIKRREDQHRPWTPVTCDHSAVITVR